MASSNFEFAPISSSIDPSFWNKLTEIKLNDDKLEEKNHLIWGYFSNINNKCNIPIVEVNSTSFNKNFETQKIYIPFHGKILNLNTIELFKEFDKSEIIDKIGQTLLECIEKGEALNNPSLLNQFFILSFADLKKFNFYYWFAFPVPRNLLITSNAIKKITSYFTTEQLRDLWYKYCELDIWQKPFFMVTIENDSFQVSPLMNGMKDLDEENYAKYFFAFYDVSLLENCPGSTLRNYITLILHHCPFLQGKSINFLSLRIKREESIITITHSLIFNLELPTCKPSISHFINEDPQQSWVGWEKNERGKMGPRLSNMKNFLDPKELAANSVDLNLKLMKWRLMSNIDLEKIKQTKFLLLGSGTLGCSVARILLGWGSRYISFVDNSVVSYSNPVRQSLFTFEDSKNSKPKALAASDNLRNIFPGVKSNSFELTIPMPGHSIGENILDQVKRDCEILTCLIQDHDVIFLLMDSRESRWLPTLLGIYYDKTVINAALGFDSYLVMRHGVYVAQEEFKVRQYPPGFKCLKGNYLGCYFCNDVTAPGNSMRDRTLDQQCTVTRPGISAIAGALAAELAISILQHKEGAKAPAFFQIGSVINTETELDNQCVLGIIPHSIRGYLSSFSQVLPATERYKSCVACSKIVQEAYRKEGFDFILKVLQNSKYLEDITGLSALTKEAEDIGVWEFSDEEEIKCFDYDGKQSECSSNKADETELDLPISREYGVSQKTESNQKRKDENNLCGRFGDLQNTLRPDNALMSEKKCSLRVSEGFLEKIISKMRMCAKHKVHIEMEKESNVEASSVHFSKYNLPSDILMLLDKKNFVSSAESSIFGTNEKDTVSSLSKRNSSLSTISGLEENQCSFKLYSSQKPVFSKEIPSSSSEQKSQAFKAKNDLSRNLRNLSALEKSANSHMDINAIQCSNKNKYVPEVTIMVEEHKSTSSDKCGQFNSTSDKIITPNYNSSEVGNKSQLPEFVESRNEIIILQSEICSVATDSSQSLDSEYIRLATSNFSETFIKQMKEGKNINQNEISSLQMSQQCTHSKKIYSEKKVDITNRNNESLKIKQKKQILTLLTRNIRSSSESLIVDGSQSEREDENNERIITLADVKEMLSSGSLTSEGLKIDESIYYLAKSD